MQWLAKHTRAQYAKGATRLFRRFAWLPVYIAGKIVWLEYFETLQMYDVTEYQVLIEESKVSFHITKWIDLSKRIIE